MSQQNSIVILTSEFDPHADFVVEELKSRSENVIRYHTSAFPTQSELSAKNYQGEWVGSLTIGERIIQLNSVKSIWYRRPAAFQFNPDMLPNERRFAIGEARAGIGGILRSLDCLWVNHPEKVVSASYKPLQLKCASKVGLTIPPTLITNKPDEVVSFYNELNGQIIYKTLWVPIADESDADASIIYTSIVHEEDLVDVNRVRNTTCLFQKFVRKKVDLRVIVIGERVFCGEIHSQDSPKSSVDFRASYNSLTYSSHSLPDDVKTSCLMLTRHMGLSFAAIDMVLDQDDGYTFLELNPNGQWRWIEDYTGLRLTSAMADLLIQGQ